LDTFKHSARVYVKGTGMWLLAYLLLLMLLLFFAILWWAFDEKQPKEMQIYVT